MLKNKSKINDVLTSSIKDVNSAINVDTVVGTPIKCDNDFVIPISKTTTCLLGGGGEYGKVKIFDKSKTHPFAGGSGALVNVFPIGFLIGKNGRYNFIKTSLDAFDKITETTLDLINKITKGEQIE